MANHLQKFGSVKLDNLAAAKNDVGSGGGSGGTFLRVDDRTGAVTFGREGLPLPPKHKFAVGLHSFAHGYIDMQGGVVVDRAVVPMQDQPTRPVPPGGKYGSYEGGGPRNVTEITLTSIDEPGFDLVFTAFGQSSANRLRNLLEEALLHTKSPEGAAGFIHPVITVHSSHYPLKGRTLPNGTQVPARTLHHFDYARVDWIREDGELASKAAPSAIAAPDAASEAAPWDADDDELSDIERELGLKV